MLWTACGAPFEAIGKPLKGSAMGTRQIVVTERDCETLHKRIELLTGGVDEDSWSSVRRLHEELNHATILHGEPVPEDVVTMNSSLILLDTETDRERLCTLVYPGFLSDAPDHISVLSPLGTSLLGSRVGETVVYERDGAEHRAVVVDIVYQPEAEGHAHL